MSSVRKLLRCELCENKFTRHCDLEIHLKTKHEERQEFTCTKSEKTLVTKWRLKKHLKIQSEANTKPCIYFMGRVECPFEELGCKFLHSFAEDTSDKVENKSKPDYVDKEGEDKKFDKTSENTPLCTSTPKRTMKQCEECVDGLECINCLIRNTDSLLLRNKFGQNQDGQLNFC